MATALTIIPATVLGPVATSSDSLPVLAAVATWGNDRAADATEDFLGASIANANTREAYTRAISRFVQWCEAKGLRMQDVTPADVAAYRDLLSERLTAPSVKQHLSALRHWFDKLVLAHVILISPARSVRPPKFRRTTGATPWLPPARARHLRHHMADAIDDAEAAGDYAGALVALRDRAFIAVMLFAFGRVSAVIGMRVRDYLNPGDPDAAKFRFHEKRGRVQELPAHSDAMKDVDSWLLVSGLSGQPDAPLFPATTGGIAPRLTARAMTRRAALDIVKKWCASAGLPANICNHSFRATGLTTHRKRGGDIRRTQKLAGHADISTTMLYDHSDDDIERAEVEMVRL